MTSAGMRQRLCGLWLVSVACFPGGVAAAAEPATKRTAEQLSQAIATAQVLSEQMVPYDVVFRRNPLKSLIDAQGHLVASSGMSGGLFVQGIIWSGERPLVVIDDELFAQGDVVGPYTILQIMSDNVIVQRGIERLTIPLDRGIDQSHEERLTPPQ